ncbi:MAG TPA: hypothetical protein VEL74_12975 [Thermoanaerobaculia bacterium]|nr:hypothetical protein [Thermoanaerobaculia bacterium]
MKTTRSGWTRTIFMSLGLALVVGIGHTAPPPPPQCFEVDNGSGTVTLPPANCEYLGPNDVHKIIAGLPVGTEIILAPIHRNFICRTGGACGSSGGSLGGEREVFSSDIVFQVTGTGALSGWSRTLTIPLQVETHTAPRTPGAPVQSFRTDMYRIQGGITNDPDFGSFTIRGGTANGYPSPGHTTLTRQLNRTFHVDSSFDVTVAIDFVGAGPRLGNYRGRTVRKVTMKAFGEQ